MSKEIKFFITDFREFHKIVNSPIRTKEDIIRILLLSVKILLVEDKFRDEDKGAVKIIIDSNSRIYFECKERGELPSKYYSFVFPFFLEKNNENWLIKCKTSLEIIDSELVDYLIVLLNKGWFSDENKTLDDIDKFACDYLEVVEDYYNSKGISPYEKESKYIKHWSVIKRLFTFEPSYVRYDYDPKYKNGDIHPLNHIDIHYAQSGTFKLGFDNSIKINERLEFNVFKDILENGKARGDICYKIK